MGVPKRLTSQQIKFANLLVAEQGRKTQLGKQLVYYRIQKNIH